LGYWPPEMEAALVKACMTSASYGIITRQLNDAWPKYQKTRNAVLGKARRMGIDGAKPVLARTRASAQRQRRKPPEALGLKRNARTSPGTGLAPVVFRDDPAGLRSEAEGRLSYAQHKGRIRGADNIAAAKLGKVPSIVEQAPLTSVPHAECERDVCQWPTTESIACMEVCGAKAEIGAYCARHAQVAYRVMPTVRRNRCYLKDDAEFRSSVKARGLGGRYKQPTLATEPMILDDVDFDDQSEESRARVAHWFQPS
jgi:hypothetical protein